MHAEIWEPIEGIANPCSEISFAYSPPYTATVSMKFYDNFDTQSSLTIKFARVVLLSSEDECPGGFVQTPKPLPKLGRGEYPTYTFPLLKIIDSEPVKLYGSIFHKKDEPLAHFCLVSAQNIVHVLASTEAEVAWEQP
jgi:hypothetical protein